MDSLDDVYIMYDVIKFYVHTSLSDLRSPWSINQDSQNVL
jgi:hypothetical protein